MSKWKLFFFPYGGGSAITYLSWKRFFDPSIKLIPVETAGRGKRINEKPHIRIADAVEDLYGQIISELNDDSPFAFFGHSMGTILAYELVRLLQSRSKPEPQHIFFSGRVAPNAKGFEKHKLSTLSTIDFITKVVELGILNSEIATNQPVIDLILPLLRADFTMVERYEPPHDSFLLHGNISVFYGTEDHLNPETGIKRWAECTSGETDFYHFNGGHFFLNTYKQKIAEIIGITFRKYQ